MSGRRFKLGEIAPAVTAKPDSIRSSEKVWLLNLDQIESHSGRLISKQVVELSSAGSSTNWFDESNLLYSKLRPYLNKVYLIMSLSQPHPAKSF